MKSFTGCWTCRLRRKKCDEHHPVCNACITLRITCYFDTEKPEWMDGGAKQEEMADRLRREVKENSYSRRHNDTTSQSSVGEVLVNSTNASMSSASLMPQQCGTSVTASNIGNDEITMTYNVELPPSLSCNRNRATPQEEADFGQSDTFLFVFYLENLFPFLFPFYQPSSLQGGKAWILELMIRSPAVRHAIQCQSSYFFSLVQGITNSDLYWQAMLSQTNDAFTMLRQALQVICNSNVSEHVHGAVRILASIMQMQRFEIAISSFDNCRAHLSAALALFRQLMDCMSQSTPKEKFSAIMSRLRPATEHLPASCSQILSAEQAAFQFSSGLVVFDDIIASTSLQEQPKLHEYHHDLLTNVCQVEPLVNLEAVVGCQNWVLVQIGEIAVLDAWKQQHKRIGNLDIMELVKRATSIRMVLEFHFIRSQESSSRSSTYPINLLDVLTKQTKIAPHDSVTVTQIWAHAAYIYLFVVVSGLQPANPDISHHVGQVVNLLENQTLSPSILRTMAWPFCVAGCLVEQKDEACFRKLVADMQPPSISGTLRKALQVMEEVWRSRKSADNSNWDLATCFRTHDNLVLFV